MFYKKKLYTNIDKELNKLWVAVLLLWFLNLLVAGIVVGKIVMASNDINPLSDPQNWPVVSKTAPERTETDLCGLDTVICENEQPEPLNTKSIIGTIYAYNPLEGQTDSDPCITADGSNSCRNDDGSFPRNIVANNCLPFDTVVIINNNQYVVRDRMNRRYGCEVFDILMPTYKEAREWGKRKLEVTILE